MHPEPRPLLRKRSEPPLSGAQTRELLVTMLIHCGGHADREERLIGVGQDDLKTQDAIYRFEPTKVVICPV